MINCSSTFKALIHNFRVSDFGKENKDTSTTRFSAFVQFGTQQRILIQLISIKYKLQFVNNSKQTNVKEISPPNLTINSAFILVT